MSTKQPRIINKHDIEANWKKAKNFVPLKAELIVYDPDENNELPRFKFGDGITNVNDLPFVTIGKKTSEGGEIFNLYEEITESLGSIGGINIGNQKLPANTAGKYAHAEGVSTAATGKGSHAEGAGTKADAEGSHAEGTGTLVTGAGAHAEGRGINFKVKVNKIEGDVVTVKVDGTSLITGASELEAIDVNTVIWHGTNSDNTTGKFYYVTKAELNKVLGVATSCKITLDKTPEFSTDVSLTVIMGAALSYMSHVEGNYSATLDIDATSLYSEEGSSKQRQHAEGTRTLAIGYASHTEGDSTRAIGSAAHAEGNGTLATGITAHSEGYHTEATGDYSHSGGYGSKATGWASVAEGNENTASGSGSHAEGSKTNALAEGAHSEGILTNAEKLASHAEGYQTTASGDYSHAEGINTTAGWGAHAEGDNTQATGSRSHAEGGSTRAEGKYSHAEGNETDATGDYSHAEGYKTLANDYSHAEGNSSVASGSYSHAEGRESQAIGTYSHAQNRSTIAEGKYSHAEGNGTKATGEAAHAEGTTTKATGDYSHAEGHSSEAIGDYSHAEGRDTEASGTYSHAEGLTTKATNKRAHAEGEKTTASGEVSHAEGYNTTANGKYSHAGGNCTVANYSNQTVIGRFNDNKENTVFEVGYGSKEDVTDENGTIIEKNRKNVFEVYQDGHAELPTQGTTDNSVIIKKALDDKYNELNGKINQLTSNGLSRIVLNALPPVSDGDESYIYMVPSQNSKESNIYDEYLFVNSKYELIGSTAVDLTGYATEDFVLENINDVDIIYNPDSENAQSGKAVNEALLKSALTNTVTGQQVTITADDVSNVQEKISVQLIPSINKVDLFDFTELIFEGNSYIPAPSNTTELLLPGHTYTIAFDYFYTDSDDFKLGQTQYSAVMGKYFGFRTDSTGSTMPGYEIVDENECNKILDGLCEQPKHKTITFTVPEQISWNSSSKFVFMGIYGVQVGSNYVAPTCHYTNIAIYEGTEEAEEIDYSSIIVTATNGTEHIERYSDEFGKVEIPILRPSMTLEADNNSIKLQCTYIKDINEVLASIEESINQVATNKQDKIGDIVEGEYSLSLNIPDKYYDFKLINKKDTAQSELILYYYYTMLKGTAASGLQGSNSRVYVGYPGPFGDKLFGSGNYSDVAKIEAEVIGVSGLDGTSPVKICNVDTPSSNLDAVNKEYVDNQIGNINQLLERLV